MYPGFGVPGAMFIQSEGVGSFIIFVQTQPGTYPEYTKGVFIERENPVTTNAFSVCRIMGVDFESMGMAVKLLESISYCAYP